MKLTRINGVGGLLAALSLSCASNAPSAPPARQPSKPVETARAEPPISGADREVRALERRAREQLDVLELELGRVALRLEYEGTREQIAEWAVALSDIEHDRRVLDYELGLVERAPHPEFVESGPVVAMIDMLTTIAAQTIIEIDQSLDDAPAEPVAAPSP